MNRVLTTIFLVSSLALIEGCSTISATRQPSEPSHQTEHSEASTHTASEAAHDIHGGSAAVTSTVKLIAPDAHAVNADLPLALHVTDANGEAIAKFETFQEQVMHLIVVNDDLSVFQHLHPTYEGNGHFTVNANLPKAGNYTLFADYKPTGSGEQVSVLPLPLAGGPSIPQPPTFERTKTIGTTQATLALEPAEAIANQDATLTFDFKDAATGATVTDLQPYLGEAGHLVIIRDSNAETLSRSDYIHAHALHDSPTGQVSFAAQFPEPGRYKVWGQFNRGGEIVTADYWLTVQ